MSKHLAWSEYPSHVNDWHGSGHALCSDPTAIICQILKIVFIFRLPNWKRWPNISSFQKYQAKRSDMFNKSMEETNTKLNWIWTSSTKKVYFSKKARWCCEKKKTFWHHNSLFWRHRELSSKIVICLLCAQQTGKTGAKQDLKFGNFQFFWQKMVSDTPIDTIIHLSAGGWVKFSWLNKTINLLKTNFLHHKIKCLMLWDHYVWLSHIR